MSDTMMSTYKHSCWCHAKLMSLNGEISPGFSAIELLIVLGAYVLLTPELIPGNPQSYTPETHTSDKKEEPGVLTFQNLLSGFSKTTPLPRFS